MSSSPTGWRLRCPEFVQLFHRGWDHHQQSSEMDGCHVLCDDTAVTASAALVLDLKRLEELLEDTFRSTLGAASLAGPPIVKATLNRDATTCMIWPRLRISFVSRSSGIRT